MTAYELHKHIQLLEEVHYMMHGTEETIEKEVKYLEHQSSLPSHKSFLFKSKEESQKEIDRCNNRMEILNKKIVFVSSNSLINK